MVCAHAAATVGLVLLAVLPQVASDPYDSSHLAYRHAVLATVAATVGGHSCRESSALSACPLAAHCGRRRSHTREITTRDARFPHCIGVDDDRRTC